MPTVRKVLLLTPAVLIAFLLLSAAAFAASSKTGIVTGGVVNLRATPDTSAKILAQLEKGKKVSVLDSRGDWFKVSVNDTTGWINGKYLIIRDQVTDKGVISGSVVNVRSKPDINSEILAKLEKGTKVDIYERSGDWYRISIGEERFGWVNEEFLSVRNDTVSRGLSTDVEIPVAVTDENNQGASGDGQDASKNSGNDGISSGDIRRQIVAYAKKFIGVRYKYGGSTPKGFDCSGFVGYVFSHFGINLERSSRDIGSNGNAVKKDDLQPGDLVFFDTNGGKNAINHVGIYIGSGKFIHASSGSGHRRVMISSLNESFYSKSYMRARDYLPE